MIFPKQRLLFRLVLGLCFGLALIAPSLTSAQDAAQPTVRAEIGKPLQAAQTLISEGKFKQALAKIDEASAIKDRSPFETYLIERLRGGAASAMGDTQGAIAAYSAVIGSSYLSAADKPKLIDAVGSLYYQQKDYPQAIEWFGRYFREGGTDPKRRVLMIQAMYLGGDFAGTVKESADFVRSLEKAGQSPAENQLQLYANAALKQKDDAGYSAAMEKLVTYYPKAEYWADLINRTARKPGFAQRLALDVSRLQFATLSMTSASDYVDAAQLALQAGLPGEAQTYLAKGFAAGLLGGADADRNKRLRDLADKQAAQDKAALAQSEAEANKVAKDGTPLVNTGMAYLGYGDLPKGIALVEAGLAKGGLKHPDDAKLRLGAAYLAAGRKNDAIKALSAIQGADGPADLARLWKIVVSRPSS